MSDTLCVKIGLLNFKPIASNFCLRAGIIFSQVQLHTQQHTVGSTENSIGPRAS
jgi:hypothetical protein